MAGNTLNSEDVLGKEPYIDVNPLYDILRNCSESFKKYNVILAAIDIGLFNYLYLNAPQSVSVLSFQLYKLPVFIKSCHFFKFGREFSKWTCLFLVTSK